jgi:hypothetical protein
MLKLLKNWLVMLFGLLKKLFVSKQPPCKHFNRTNWKLRRLTDGKSYFYFYCKDCEKIIAKRFK